MKKIGILSEYYHSINYGGNLQAFALCKYLNSHTILAEQVQYDRSISNEYNNTHKNIYDRLLQKVRAEGIAEFIKNRCEGVFNRILAMTLAKLDKGELAKRPLAFKEFNSSIPHSESIYNDDNISNCTDKYDFFIVGSDQVWRNIRNRAYYLEFVPKGIKKISYAASISKDQLSNEEKEFYRMVLPSFEAISVREKDAVELLQGLSKIEAEWVVDPTMLISIDEWNKIASKRIVDGKYIFAFFIGTDKKQRQLAKKTANSKGCKLVTIPYLRGRVDSVDFFVFNGKNVIKVFDASPNDFLSLIKYSDEVYTDSFHCTVFSILFNRPFFTFERPEKETMSSRISNLLSLYNLSDRFIDREHQDKTFINSNSFHIRTEEADALIDKSKDFLSANLK